MEKEVVLSVKNIHKSFPGVRALQGVDFRLCKGEIHALMGENGAGKSTLIKVLTGVYTKDEGEMKLENETINIHSPEEAQAENVAVQKENVVKPKKKAAAIGY